MATTARARWLIYLLEATVVAVVMALPILLATLWSAAVIAWEESRINRSKKTNQKK